MDKQFFERLTDWQDRTFSGGNALGALEHLKEELKEIEAELLAEPINKTKLSIELADAAFLIIAIANRAGLTYEQVTEAQRYKFVIVKNREYGPMTEKGVFNHKKKE